MNLDTLLDTLIRLRNRHKMGSADWLALDTAIVRLIAYQARPISSDTDEAPPFYGRPLDPQIISRLKGAIGAVTSKCYKREISDSDAVTDIISLIEGHTAPPRDLIDPDGRPAPFCIQPHDRMAAAIIMTWIAQAKDIGVRDAKIVSARRHRDSIIAWQRAHPDLIKIPD